MEDFLKELFARFRVAKDFDDVEGLLNEPIVRDSPLKLGREDRTQIEVFTLRAGMDGLLERFGCSPVPLQSACRVNATIMAN